METANKKDSLKSKEEKKKYSISLLPNNIVKLAYEPNVHIDVDDIKKSIEEAVALVGNKPFFSMVDLQNKFVTISAEAKKLIATDPDLKRLRYAEAILVNSLSMKLMSNAYLSFNKPATPTRAFTNEDAALTWFAERTVKMKAKNEGSHQL